MAPKKAAGGAKAGKGVKKAAASSKGASSGSGTSCGAPKSKQSAILSFFASAVDKAAVALKRTSSSSSRGDLVASGLAAALREPGWSKALAEEFTKPYFAEIERFVAEERKAYSVHPPADKVFEALNVTPHSKVKVVILGQDPYHEPGQAHGLCFSVLPGVKPPPSLKNMYKELVNDVSGFVTPSHGHLLGWAQQGVLMLNATLTVREGHKEANSHSKCGWQRFTDAVIEVLNRDKNKIVFLLWGGFAQKKGKIIDRSRHTVIESAHPSPLSFKKWQGCKTFSKCNAALKKNGQGEVDWCKLDR
jgi:uracil-DNA glycosylase